MRFPAVRLPAGRTRRIVLLEAAAVLVIGVAVAAVLAARVLDRAGSVPPTAAPSIAILPSPVPSSGPGGAGATDAPPGRPSPIALRPASSWALPTGWRYDLECDDSDCNVSLFDETGRVRDGWPVTLRGDCPYEAMAVGPDASLFVACTRGSRAVVTGLDQTGEPLPGWPVSVPGSVAWSTWNDFGWGGSSSSIAVGPDATVYLAANPAGDGGRYGIHAFAPDGSPRDGWPRRLAGGAQGFTLGPDGTVVAWWYEGIEGEIGLYARRTVFTMLGPDGATLPGWPVGSKGAASGPVVWTDGSLYYVAASGNVYGHDRTGSIIRGWPYRLPEPVAPVLRPDGTLLFVGASQVDVLDRAGRPAKGWPYRTKAILYGPMCDTPGMAYTVSAVSPAGRLYLAEWNGSRDTITALETDGRMAAGWPYRVPEGWRVTWLQVDEENVVAHLAGDGCGDGYDDASLALTPAGEVVGNLPGTPQKLVYEAMRLDGLRTLDGALAYPPGWDIVLEFGLVNRSARPVVLPRLETEEGVEYATGMIQTWIERLGPETEIDCLPEAGQKDAWYAVDGWVEGSDGPVTIPAGGSMRAPFQRTLWSGVTACLPPGTYRYHVEYKPLFADVWDDPLDEAAIDLTILPAEPGASWTPSEPPWTPSPPPRPTPTPTPRPTPTPSPTPPPTPPPSATPAA